MRIEVFEIKGYVSNELPTDLDVLILNIRERNPSIQMKKINIMNREDMKPHKDVIQLVKDRGLSALPVIKVDGKFVRQSELEGMVNGRLKAR